MQCEKIIKEFEGYKSARSVWDTRWQKILEWYAPYRAEVTESSNIHNTTYRNKIHDTKGTEAAQVLIAAHSSYITPPNELWLQFTPNYKLAQNDDAVSWLKKCSEITLGEFALSNFYSSINSLNEDRVLCGTGAMYIEEVTDEETLEKTVNFVNVPIGTFCFGENSRNIPNRFYREYKLTLQQAIEEFGEENLGDKLKAKVVASDSQPSILAELHPFLQVTRPRKDRKKGAIDSLNKRFEDFNICLTDKKILKEGGYDEFPYMITRYSKSGNYLWGISPALMALPNVITSNYIMQILKTLGEVAAVPRIFRLAGSKGKIDMRGGSTSYISREEAQMGYPKEYGTNARYDYGKDLLDMQHKHIDAFFHVPLFQMFASLEKEMTATEIGAREREKLLMWSPSFNQYAYDQKHGMIRVFSILMRQGKFPEPPESLIESKADGTPFMSDPEIRYNSKIALAIKALQGEGFDRLIQRAMQLGDLGMQVLQDNFDLDIIFRNMGRNEGMAEETIKKEEVRDQLRQAMQEKQQMLEESMMAEQQAAAVGKLGGAEGIKKLDDL